MREEQNRQLERAFSDEMIREKLERKKELQDMYRHAVERSQEIRTKIVPPEKEAERKRILARYNTEKTRLNREINDLGEEIWKMQKEAENDV